MISYELAKELKENDFPQPEPRFSQVWYADYDNGHMLGRKLLVGTNEFLDVQRMEQPMVFCPNFEDIWAQLPENIFDKGKSMLHYFKEMGNFHLSYKSSTNNLIGETVRGGDISEAAAKLWLKLKERVLI